MQTYATCGAVCCAFAVNASTEPLPRQPQTIVFDLFQEKVQLFSVGQQTFGSKVLELVAKQGRKARSPFTYR